MTFPLSPCLQGKRITLAHSSVLERSGIHLCNTFQAIVKELVSNVPGAFNT